MGWILSTDASMPVKLDVGVVRGRLPNDWGITANYYESGIVQITSPVAVKYNAESDMLRYDAPQFPEFWLEVYVNEIKDIIDLYRKTPRSPPATFKDSYTTALFENADLLRLILERLQLVELVSSLGVNRIWNHLSGERISNLWPLFSRLLDSLLDSPWDCTRANILNAQWAIVRSLRYDPEEFKFICEALANGALPHCLKLSIQDSNQIGDAGITALAQAIKPVSDGGSGAMASLKVLYVSDGPLGTEHPALKAACVSRGIRLP
jgi:hypothetical protein